MERGTSLDNKQCPSFSLDIISVHLKSLRSLVHRGAIWSLSHLCLPLFSPSQDAALPEESLGSVWFCWRRGVLPDPQILL